MTVRRVFLGLVAVTLSMALGNLAAFAGPVGLIDDFSDASLAEYTLTKILDQGAGTNNIGFVTDPNEYIVANSTGTTGAEQVLLFRNDGYDLDPNQELQIDGPSTEAGASTEDLGLAIGQTPTALVGAGSTRNMADYVFISYRNPTQLNTRGFVNNVEIGQVQAFGVTATKLFIARLSNNDIELGYYNGDARTVVRTITPTNLGIFNNVGFYADLRADGANIYGLDNLTIVPEPSAAVLALAALAGLVRRRR